MFPTNVEQHYQQRNRRRGRNDPNNRDYICPCGKSYLSYPALFTHIKTKHNGRAPGQIIKPKPQNSRRGRPNKARQIYDSDSQTDDIASNSLDRLCDFVLSTEVEKPQLNLKQIFLNDTFYEIYANYNQQQQEPKYNDNEDLYEETCENVFSQFLAQIHKKLNDPFFVDVLFLFVMMLARGINKKNNNDEQVKEEPIQNIVEYVNMFLLQTLPEFVQTFKITQIQLFKTKSMAKLIEFFYNWLTMKKYLAVKVKVDNKYFEEQ